MSLGQNLADARRHKGLSQEAVAERLGVSRQTISKWETDETLPDIFQSKKLATLYELSLDKLVSFDADLATIAHAITYTPDSAVAKVDWTAMWAKKYPVLASYQGKVAADRYAAQLRTQLAAPRLRLQRAGRHAGAQGYFEPGVARVGCPFSFQRVK